MTGRRGWSRIFAQNRAGAARFDEGLRDFAVGFVFRNMGTARLAVRIDSSNIVVHDGGHEFISLAGRADQLWIYLTFI